MRMLWGALCANALRTMRATRNERSFPHDPTARRPDGPTALRLSTDVRRWPGFVPRQPLRDPNCPRPVYYDEHEDAWQGPTKREEQ